MNVIGTGSSGNIILIEKNGKQYAQKCLQFSEIGINSILEIIFGYGNDNKYVGRIEFVEFDDSTRNIFIYSNYIPNNASIFFRKKIKLSLDEIKDFTICLLRGLEYIHSFDIIHRDIKPSNILIDIEDNCYVPKIIDFGISVQAHSVSGKAYTLYYRAPEIWDSKYHDISADIWALGCTLYEIYHHEILFPINKIWERKTILKKGIEKLKRSEDPFDHFLLKMIDIDPKNRSSVSELLACDFLGNLESCVDEKYNDLTINHVYHKLLELFPENNDPDFEVACQIIASKILGLEVSSLLLSKIDLDMLYYYEKKVILFLRPD